MSISPVPHAGGCSASSAPPQSNPKPSSPTTSSSSSSDNVQLSPQAIAQLKSGDVAGDGDGH
jgi:hypothetical protein